MILVSTGNYGKTFFFWLSVECLFEGSGGRAIMATRVTATRTHLILYTFCLQLVSVLLLFNNSTHTYIHIYIHTYAHMRSVDVPLLKSPWSGLFSALNFPVLRIYIYRLCVNQISLQRDHFRRLRNSADFTFSQKRVSSSNVSLNFFLSSLYSIFLWYFFHFVHQSFLLGTKFIRIIPFIMNLF